jgi:hypothetical protein
LTPQIKYSFLKKAVWFLLRRVKRLGSEKPWQPILNIWKTVPKPNPGKTGDDKNFKRLRNENNSSDTSQLHHAAHAYVHVLVKL